MQAKTFRHDENSGGDGKKKLISFAVWLSGINRLDCETCQATWADFDGVPPCKTCRPELEPDNAEAVKIYQQCSGQWIVSVNGIVDINILAVIEVMKLKKIEDMDECLEKVQLIAFEVLRAHKKQ